MLVVRRACGQPRASSEGERPEARVRQAPYTDLRTLTRFSGDDRHDFRGPNSPLVKFNATLCARCNNTRSQPFDNAWDVFVAHLADHEAEIVATQQIDWVEVRGDRRGHLPGTARLPRRRASGCQRRHWRLTDTSQATHLAMLLLTRASAADNRIKRSL